MEKPDTINVIGGDNAEEISRAIIKAHEYYLMNLDLLNDRERGYFFNEYFPAVNKYLKPLKPLEPMIFTGDSVGKHYPQPDIDDHETPEEIEPEAS